MRWSLAPLLVASMAHAEPIVVDASLRAIAPMCNLSAVGFADAHHGLASDRCGELFETTDGAVTWKRVAPHARGIELPVTSFRGKHPIDALIWFSPSTAFAHVDALGVPATGYRTTDGGATWKPVAMPVSGLANSAPHVGGVAWICGGSLQRSLDEGATWAKLDAPYQNDVCGSLVFSDALHGTMTTNARHVYSTNDGGLHWAARPAAPDTARSAPHAQVVIGPKIVATWEDRRLAIVVDGVLERRTELLERTGPPRDEVLLSSTVRDDDVRFGLSREHAYRSSDAGRHWYAVGDLPKGSRRAAFVSSAAAVAEVHGGLLVSPDGGQAWTPSPSPEWSRFELERALGGRPENPLACTIDSRAGSFRVRYGIEADFGGSEDELTLAWSGAQGTLQGVVVDRARVRAVVQQIVDAASRVENPPSGWSTNQARAKLTWTCDGRSRSLEMSASAFEDADLDGHYMRALGVSAVAKRAVAP